MELSDLKPNPKNPRKITDKKLKALKKALEEFGDLGGIVFNRRTQRLVGGHQRMQVLPKEATIELDWECNVPQEYTSNGTCAQGYLHHPTWGDFSYREVDWDENKEAAANIAANKGAGEWDDDGLKAMLKDLDMANFDLDLTMFDADELKDLLKEPEVFEEGLTDPDSIPENVETRCKPGDLWLLGNHRLLCGDSTDVLQVERLMGGEKADMVFTDPPYGMSAVSKSGVLSDKYSRGDIMNDDNVNVAKDAFNLCYSLDISKMVFWGANYYSSALPDATCWLVWDKNNGQSDQMDCELAWTNFKGCTRQFTQASEKTNRVHPTQKPVSLAEWCLLRWEAKSVLDLFGGSGSTLIACEKIKIECFAMELDAYYCDIIIERWEKFTGQKAVLSSI